MGHSIHGIKALLFDMDGTLVNSIEAVVSAWTAWAKKHSLDPAETLHVAHGRPARDTIRLLRPKSDLFVEEQWVLNRELAEKGVTPVPGVKPYLESLEGIPWGIVTSANRSLALHRLQLAKLPIPSLLITVEDITKGKPDPEGYLLGAARLKINPAHCLVFEDTPAGLKAGKDAGMKCVGLTTTFPITDLHAECLIKDYTQAKILRKDQGLELIF